MRKNEVKPACEHEWIDSHTIINGFTLPVIRCRKCRYILKVNARIKRVKEYPHSTEYKPGTWKGIKTAKGRQASFTCPDCGLLGSLINHEVASDGTVTPSVVCPHNCGFHEFIKLIGWQE